MQIASSKTLCKERSEVYEHACDKRAQFLLEINRSMAQACEQTVYSPRTLWVLPPALIQSGVQRMHSATLGCSRSTQPSFQAAHSGLRNTIGSTTNREN